MFEKLRHYAFSQCPIDLEKTSWWIGTIAALRLGVADAKLLAPVFAPLIGIQDLIESPRWQGCMRIHGTGAISQPFSFHTMLDSAPPDRAWASELLEYSRQRWGVPASEIEARIQRRNRFINGLPHSAEQQLLDGIPNDEACAGPREEFIR